MSFLAKLNIDGQQYNILHCIYSFEQPMDATGKPAGRPTGGRIMATIEADGSYDLLHWMSSPDQTKDGSIVFYKRDALSRLQEVFFKRAYCVSLEVEFDAVDESPLQNRIVISAESLKIGDMTFENPWGAQHCLSLKPYYERKKDQKTPRTSQCLENSEDVRGNGGGERW